MKFLMITLLFCILAVSGKPEPESAKPKAEPEAEPESEPEPEGEAETCIGDHCVPEKGDAKHDKAEPKSESGVNFTNIL
jgi:hypothetical protein